MREIGQTGELRKGKGEIRENRNFRVIVQKECEQSL